MAEGLPGGKTDGAPLNAHAHMNHLAARRLPHHSESNKPCPLGPVGVSL